MPTPSQSPLQPGGQQLDPRTAAGAAPVNRPPREATPIDRSESNWRTDLVLYRHLIGARVRSQMQYRRSFFLQTLGGLLVTGAEFFAIVLLFGRFSDLAGWSVGEVALLYGLAAVAFGLNEMVGAGFDIFPVTIQRGELDRVLLRPAGIFPQVLANDFQMRRLGRISQGLVVLGLATQWTQIDWTPLKVAYLVLALISGAVMYTALTILGAVLCFWTVQSIELINTLTYGGTELASYPLTIYHEGLQRFFTFVVPLAFVSYFPALYLLDRLAVAGYPDWVPLMTPLAALAILLVARWTWSVGVAHYQSTGS